MFRVGLRWIISRREVGGKNSLLLEMERYVPLGVGVALENSAGLWKDRGLGSQMSA